MIIFIEPYMTPFLGINLTNNLTTDNFVRGFNRIDMLFQRASDHFPLLLGHGMAH